MKTTTLGLALLSSSLLSAFALDSDPGYGPRTSSAPAATGTAASARRGATNSAYLKPTMRYYGKGYTVAYRYVPWSDRSASFNLEGHQFRLPATAADSLVGSAPRVVYYWDKKSGGSVTDGRAVVTAPVPSRDLPAIGERVSR